MRINFWYISSLFISIFVIIPILTVFLSFFESTSNYYGILKDTFLFEYIYNSIILLISVLLLTFLIGTGSAYLVSFFEFPLSNFFKWALILSFAVPPYIYAYSLTAFFENYGTAFTILKNLFGDGNYNNNIPDLKVPSKRNIERIKNSETENAKKKKRKKRKWEDSRYTFFLYFTFF